MTDGLLTHLTHDQLAAFSAGRLGNDDSAVVEQHLANCSECCEWLKQTPTEDSYVRLLREAVSPETSSTRAMIGSETEIPDGGRLKSELAGLPAAFVEHPRYHVLRLLGRGGMGNVFEAEHRLMRRRVALKIIKPQWLNHPEAISRFRNEVQAAAKLVHPNVVTAFDAEQAGDVHFLAMEFVEGMTLAELVAQRGPLSIDVACEYIRQAALGLQFAHEHGMVHRDIKPGNLMVSEGRDKDALALSSSLAPRPAPLIKILDFGLARFVSESDDLGRQTGADTLLGTPDFMAPEQARDARSADIRSDIYSLGCTLYFLLTGEAPHARCGSPLERALAHLERDPDPLSKFRSDAPDGLQVVLNKMMARRAEGRFQTPADVATALKWPTRFESVGCGTHPPRPLAAGAKRVLLATALVGFVAVMAIVVQIVTDKGELQIQSDIAGTKLTVRQNGQSMRMIVTQIGVTNVRLFSGVYDLDLQDTTTGLQVQPAAVDVKRGKVTSVVVRQR